MNFIIKYEDSYCATKTNKELFREIIRRAKKRKYVKKVFTSIVSSEQSNPVNKKHFIEAKSKTILCKVYSMHETLITSDAARIFLLEKFIESPFLTSSFPHSESIRFVGLRGYNDISAFDIFVIINSIIICIVEKGVRILKLDFMLKSMHNMNFIHPAPRSHLLAIEEVIIYYLSLITSINYNITHDEDKGTIYFSNGSQLTVKTPSAILINESKRYDYVIECDNHEFSLVRNE
jgi:hypothetical protein